MLTFGGIDGCSPVFSFMAGGKGGSMDSQPDRDENGKVVKPLPKKPYAEPVLLALGSFSELTMTVGGRGNNDGGRQSGRKSTRI